MNALYGEYIEIINRITIKKSLIKYILNIKIAHAI